MNYRNQDIIDSVEKVSKEILAESRHNRHRDYFFPMLIDRMNYKKAVEIGVDKGEFSLHLLSKSNLDKLYCIDSWLDNFGSDYKPDFYDKNGNNRMAETKRNLELYVINERVELIKSNSFDASVKFQSDELDFVYIDGDHSLEGIFVDLYSWFPKVKKGGVLSGHDFKDGPKSGISDWFGNQLPYHVQTVVEYFCKRYGLKLNVVGGRILSWWFVKC